MTIRKVLIAAAVLLLPALFAADSAQALTARQYAAQGHGRYTTSSGRPVRGYYHGYRRHHYRHYRHHHRYR